MAGEFHGLQVERLDEVDRKIVRHLQEDGRRSVATIAKDLGLSHAWTRQRVQRLLESRIVQIAAITAPATHGFSRLTFVGIRTDHRVREVAAAIAAIPEAYYVVICTGPLDLMVEVMCRDDDHMLDLITRIRSIEGVRETQTFPFLELLKWRYAPEFDESDVPDHDGALDGDGLGSAADG